jgi:hypothetical protein
VAYVPGYTYDIFVSYARWDDEPVPGMDRWVTTFLKSARSLLHGTFGRGVDDLRIFFDTVNFEANRQVPELLAAARQSAVFLAICSPNYEGREWTRAELSEFHSHTNDPRRLFAVEKMPLDEGLSYPEPLETHNRVKLWRRTEMHGDTARSMSADDPDFINRVAGLVGDIKKKLKVMHAGEIDHGPAPVTVAAMPTSGSWKTVLLAQTVDALDDQREALRLALEERGVPVLPASPGTDYPLGGEAFKAAFRSDLDRAEVFVQLLGAYPGKAPPDLPQGFTRFQAESANAKPIATLQWRSPEIQIDTIADSSHRELLNGDCVTAESFEDFKGRVLRQSAKPPPMPVADTPPGREGRKLVFVNAHKSDEQIATRVATAFSLERFDSKTPLWSGDSAEIRSSLTKNIKKCDALVVIYGNVDAKWVRQQCEKYAELRRNPALIVAVIYVPAEGKEEFGVFLPELERIPLRGELDREALRRVIEKLSS